MESLGELPIAYTREIVKSKTLDSEKKYQFSLMTYNILNDNSIRNDYKYCPLEYRYMPYRSKLIISEIKLYNPDIICMQEVQPEVYDNMLRHPLDVMGYHGSYHLKKGCDNGQGDALFYRHDVFILEKIQALRFHDLALSEIKEFTNLDPEIYKAIDDHMNTTEQMLLASLRHKASNSHLHVIGLHIHWGNLKKADIQTLQLCAGIRYLQQYIKDFDDPAYIITGDFNTPPTFPAYQMMEQTGPPNSDNIKFLQKSTFTLPDGKVGTMIDYIPSLYNISLQLVSSYKLATGSEPKITNLDDGWCSQPVPLCLDYIMITPKKLGVTGVLKMPPDEAVMKHVGLPSVLFGSDHLPLLATLSFKSSVPQ